MIATVDKNEDWKISYSEFRVLIEKDQNFNSSTLGKHLSICHHLYLGIARLGGGV